MPPPSDRPLARCNILLYEADKSWLERHYGHGWSEIVRNLVRDHVRDATQPQEAIVWPLKTER